MINTGDDIILLQDDACQRASFVLHDLAQQALKKTPHLRNTDTNTLKTASPRHKLAVSIFLERLNRDVTQRDLGLLYNLCICSDGELFRAKSTYSELTGCNVKFDEDVLGLRIPVRAMFVMLWSEGKVVVPHTFTVSGVWAKYPALTKISNNFLYKIAATSQEVVRSCRAFQYHVDWHTPKKIKFDELWEAAPLVVDTQRAIRVADPKSQSRSFRYMPWLRHFAEAYPNIITADQVRILDGYHTHLALTQNSGSSVDHKKSFEQFVYFWGSTSGKPSEEDLQRREKIRYAEDIGKRKEKNKRKFDKKSHTPDQRILAAYDILSPEDYANLPWHKPKSRENFDWVKGYYGDDIGQKMCRWVRMAELNRLTLEEKSSISHRNTQASYIHVLFDYLGSYLPNWIKKHPDTTIQLPEHITDFHRPLFWNRTKADMTLTSWTYDSSVLLPLTLMQFYDLRRSKRTKTTFIKCIHRLFATGITHASDIMPDGEPLIGPLFGNPVNLRLDPQGSGTRGSSNKKPLPIDAMTLFESYIWTLDKIGVELQERCLSGYYSRKQINKLRAPGWIDLKEHGLQHTIKLWNPTDPSEIIEVPIVRIMNIYSWHNKKYTSCADTVFVPWLSPLRMLAISLFSGLRVQNSQWLDIRSFDQDYDKTLQGALGGCSLFVNTCKNGTSRSVNLPFRIMDTLLKERDFQLHEYGAPYSGVYYQNDPMNIAGYGLIHPLFRSPWHDSGLPFSDAAYSGKWTSILRGFQEVFNSFVPQERHHEFVVCDNRGKWFAVHTPHALRATWITHRRLYASLQYEVIGSQVGHANKHTSAHYVVPTMVERTAMIASANAAVSEYAYNALMGRPQSPSSQHSAMVRGFSSDRAATIRDQHLISIIPEIMDAEETGVDLIATDRRVKFMDFCICPLAGNCPKKLMDFSRQARACGICTFAVYGIDHLPGLNAKVRDLVNVAETIKAQLQRTHQLQPDSSQLDILHEDLSLCTMELAGYCQAISILERVWTDEKLSGGYIGRYRDLSTAVRHEVDMTDPKQRILSAMIDTSQFPSFASENYPYILEELARSPEVLDVLILPTDEKEIYIGQILSIMGGTGITFEDISRRALSRDGLLALPA